MYASYMHALSNHYGFNLFIEYLWVMTVITTWKNSHDIYIYTYIYIYIYIYIYNELAWTQQGRMKSLYINEKYQPVSLRH